MHEIVNDTIKITVPKTRLFNEQTYRFTTVKEQSFVLKHSLVSISKWEAIWHRSYLSDGPANPEQKLSYYKCMTITQNVDSNAYLVLDDSDIEAIEAYMDDMHTATKFYGDQQQGKSRRLTNELFYYWMAKFNIPFSCEKWHIGKLMTLINVCALEESPPKKMSESEIFAQNRARNEARRAKLKSKG